MSHTDEKKKEMPFFDQVLYAGLGVVSMFQDQVDDLVKRGEENKTPEAKALRTYVDEMRKAGNKRQEEFEERFRKASDRAYEILNIPSRQDIEKLRKEVEELRRDHQD